MLRSLLLAAAGAALASAALVPAVEDEPFGIGDVVDADIALKDVRGEKYRLGDYRKTDEKDGQVVVLDFWSITCPVSVRYEERMKDLHAFCEEKGVKFFAINSNHTELDDGDEPYKRIKAYAKKAGVTFPILIDRGNVVADRFAAKTTPHVFIIDAEGKLRYQGAPDDDASFKKEKAGEEVRPYAKEAIVALLNGEDPPKTETRPQGCTIKRVERAEQ